MLSGALGRVGCLALRSALAKMNLPRPHPPKNANEMFHWLVRETSSRSGLWSVFWQKKETDTWSISKIGTSKFYFDMSLLKIWECFCSVAIPKEFETMGLTLAKRS